MISVAEALGLLEAETSALDPVELPLGEALGRVLARPVVADRDFPPTDRSAMDGFAVRAQDVARPGTRLRVVGEVRAGHPVGALRVGSGQAVRIMTGAIVPPGADAVVMVEHTEEDEPAGVVRIDDVPRQGQHVRPRGRDLRDGATVIEAGSPIRAAEIAALASIGCAAVRVHRPPVVHVLSTGDEVVEPEADVADHQVRNSNAHALIAQLAGLGITGRYLGIARDEESELGAKLAEGLAADVLLITGGVSAGRYDLVGETLAAAGMRRIFHKVSVKPGKPLLAGRREGCLVLGLPGNPVSTFVAFAVFVAPALRRLMGYARWANRSVTAALAEPLTARGGRESYHLAHADAPRGELEVRPVDSTGSGDVLALSRANALIVTPPEGATLARGALVPVLLWSELPSR